jgi:hypothetical protein
MSYQLFTRVALKVDVPSHKLRKGDVATIVEMHPGVAGQETGYSLEVFNAAGDTLAVVTLRESQIEAPANDAVLHVRRLEEVSA